MAARDNAINWFSLVKNWGGEYHGYIYRPPEEEGKMGKKPKNEADIAVEEEDERTYGIDFLNLHSEHDSDSDSKWIFVQGRKGQMNNKHKITISNRHECNVLSNILASTKCAKLRIVITNQY